MVIPREACLNISIKNLVIFLCYVENAEHSFFSIFYASYHKNVTRA